MENLQQHRSNRIPESREYRLRIPGSALWALQEFFTASLATYLAFYLIDTLVDSFVSKQFDMNILLWIVIISGALSVMLVPRQDLSADRTQRHTLSLMKIVWIVMLGIIAAGIVFIESRSLGRIGYLVSGIAGALTVLLLVMLFSDDRSHDPDNP